MPTLHPMNPSLLACLLLLACGCTASTATHRPSPAEPLERSWRSTQHREHPLVGRIWDARRGRWVEERELREALAQARFVLLGEQHDNPDHHLLQAELVRSLSDSGRRPALAFEMLDTEQQPAVDAALAHSPGEPDAIAQAVAWESSGWPDWALYRPLFAVGAWRGLRIIGANLPLAQVRALIGHGSEALEPELRARLGLDEPLPEDVARAMRQEMHEAHCGHLPEPMLEPMALAQRARDARMADRLLETTTNDGALLITGAGHARTDRGVPAHLARRAPGLTVRSVAFMEVSPEANEPADYAPEDTGGRLPFDYVWFTPATEREDPCEAFRKRG